MARDEKPDLARILASDTFRAAPRLREFLAFLVARQQEGKATELKESVIGTEFFSRQPGYDPKKDPIVRVEAHRLRHRLSRYYNGEGAADEWRIEVRRGTYAPSINKATASLGPWRLLVNVEASDALTSEGLTIELINRLGELHGVTVIAPRSSIATSHSVADNSELGINAFLECSFDGTNLRARLRGYDTARQKQISIFEEVVQPDVDSLTSFVASSLRCPRASLPAKHAALYKSRSVDQESYRLYLSGRAWFHRWSPDNLAQATAMFQEVVRRCPDYAPAYASLADCQMLLAYWHTTDTRVTLETGKAFSQRALELDPTCFEAYCSRGAFRATLDRDWAGAESDFTKALKANPSYTLALNWLSIIGLVPQGKFDEAIDAVFSAFDLDPVSPEISNEVVWVLICCRQFRQAVEQGKRIVELHPEFLEAYWSLGLAEAAVGNYKNSREALDVALRLAPGVSFTIAMRGFVEGSAGNKIDAENCLRRLHLLNETKSVRDLFFAWIYAGLGERDRGMDYMQRAVKAADPHSLYLDAFFVYDCFREHRAFAGLLKQLHLGV